MTSIPSTDAFAIYDIRLVEPFERAIKHALEEIHKKSGDRHTADRVYEHLKTRVVTRYRNTALYLAIDQRRVAEGRPMENSVVGFMTLDIGENELAEPMTIISRAWTEPGLGKDLWPIMKPWVWKWAKERNCETVQIQSERDSAFVHFLKHDGFKQYEVLLEARVNDGGSI